MDHKDYVSLLEQSVRTHTTAPANKIVGWDGKGPLPKTMPDDDLSKITKRIMGIGAGMEADAAGGKGKLKEDSPLSVLEGETYNKELDGILDGNLEEDVSFDEKESEVVKRLISEMDAFDDDIESDLLADVDGIDDDIIDDTSLDDYILSDDYENDIDLM